MFQPQWRFPIARGLVTFLISVVSCGTTAAKSVDSVVPEVWPMGWIRTKFSDATCVKYHIYVKKYNYPQTN